MEIKTKYDQDDIVFIKPILRGLTPMRVSEVHVRIREDKETDIYYTLRNKQLELTEEFTPENKMFISEAKAVAHYLKD